MQQQLVTRDVSNAKKNDQVYNSLNKIKVKYNDLKSKVSIIQKTKPVSKSTEALKRDEINEIYEFTHQFDGTPGTTALIFRENVKNYVKFVKSNLGIKNYLETRVVTRIIKNLTGNAKLKYSQRQGDRFDNVNAFYKWFDDEFRLADLTFTITYSIKILAH